MVMTRLISKSPERTTKTLKNTTKTVQLSISLIKKVHKRDLANISKSFINKSETKLSDSFGLISIMNAEK